MNMLLLALQTSLCLLAQASFPRASPNVPIFDVHLANGMPSMEIPIAIRNLFPKIVGGVDAIQNEYPFMVQMGVNWPATNSGSRCGASIINENFILTAAHCVYDKDQGWAIPWNIYMFLGQHDYDPKSKTYDQVVTGAQLYAYSYTPSQNINDIAIVRVSQKIQMNSKVQPICMASTTNTYADRTGSVMGWGVTKYGFLPDNGVQATEPQVLQKINMYILSAQTCSQTGPSNTTPDKVCIYDLDNKSKGVCSGDSGGPLVVNENGKYVQVGIASYITGPCGTQAVSVYARVTYFKDFIQQTVGAGAYQTC